MAKEIFQEVHEKDFPKVLKALKEDWPKHFLLHQILEVLDEYKKKGTKWKHTLYLHGDYETGVYLNKLEVEQPTDGAIYFNIYTKNPDLKPLVESLQQTNLIPWKAVEQTYNSLKFGFLITPDIYQSAIREAFAINSTTCEVDETSLFWYPPEKDLNIQPLPEEVYIDFLDGTFAEEMNRNWPHKYPGSELIHREHLEKNFGLGLFLKANKRLVCSALSNFTGGIFVLHSDTEYRGKGFAKIVVQHMVKELRHRGRIPFCTVILGNKPSEQVFSKSGFELFTKADYIFPKHDS